MHDAIGEFVDIFNTGIPTHSDCNFAVDLCKVASEVWESQTEQLQPGLHTLFEKYFEGLEVRKVTEFEAQPDERMIYGGMDIGAWELKVDTGGNTYGQIQRYYVAVWYAVEMEYLAPRDGWFPLCILAPGRQQTVPMQADNQPEPLTAPAWQRASALAAQALEHAQQHATVQFDGHNHPTVHGDVRLLNIIGHVGRQGGRPGGLCGL
ncbi:TPA: hypothetical protein ACH3X2_012288 [Trebouxia sp. C0005]